MTLCWNFVYFVNLEQVIVQIVSLFKTGTSFALVSDKWFPYVECFIATKHYINIKTIKKHEQIHLQTIFIPHSITKMKKINKCHLSNAKHNTHQYVRNNIYSIQNVNAIPLFKSERSLKWPIVEFNKTSNRPW